MDLPTTLGVLAVAALVFAFGSWRSAQPANPLKPRLVPWRLVTVFAGAAGIMMIVHLVNLFGFVTGSNQFGGARFP